MKSLYLLFLSLAFSLTAAQECTLNQFWNGQRCVPCIDSHGECTDMNSITSCSDEYYLDTSETVQTCKSCPANCLTCDYLGQGMDVICSSCKVAYSLVQGTCQYLQYCQIVNLTLGCCIQCEDGYYLDSSQVCKKCDDSCETCLNVSTCSTCKDNYSFLGSDFKCTQCSLGCKYCTTSVCLGCIDGYYMNDSKTCVACPSYCTSCVLSSDNAVKCYQCDLTTDQDKNGDCHLCSNSILNCASCTVDNFVQVCDYCESGYYLNEATNTCTLCAPPMFECSCADSDCAQFTIISCLTGYNLFDGACIAYDNCALYSSSSQCEICSKGYYLQGTGCVQQTGINDCSVYVLNENKCSICSSDFFLSSSTQCTAIETGCQTQSKANQCDIYKPYYYLSSGAITKCETSTGDSCPYLENSTGAITCSVFTFSNSADFICNVFDPSKSGCLVWQSAATGKCALCDSTNKYYLQAATGKCAIYQANCSIFNTTTEECVSCAMLNNRYYAVSSGKCLLCEDQSSGYFTCLDNISDSSTLQTNSAFVKKYFTFIIGLIYLAQILGW